MGFAARLTVARGALVGVLLARARVAGFCEVFEVVLRALAMGPPNRVVKAAGIGLH
jgi:hypothetical protein